MKMMDLLQEILGKEIGDEWVGKDGDEYELTEDGLIRRSVPKDEYVSLAEIDEWVYDMKEEFKLEVGKLYYYIGSVREGYADEDILTVKCKYYNETKRDEHTKSQGNYFETREEAKEKLDEILRILNK